MEDSCAGKKRKTGSDPRELPTLPPFTGTLEFSPPQPKARKCETLILLPAESSIWASGCALGGVFPSSSTAGERRVGKENNAEECYYDAAQPTRAIGLEKSGPVTEMEGEKRAAVIVAAEELVQRVMGAWDSSHDPFHALRVRDLALSLASEEGLRLSSFLVVELAALLHDIDDLIHNAFPFVASIVADDHKYAARGENVGNIVESFLKQHNVESNTAEAVLKIVTTMGFKEELGGGSENGPISPEFAVVRDADRLDAIGAIGIARAFTYGGSRNRKMHDPAQAPRTSLTKSDYTASDAHPTTINHFAEKLLKLKDLMKSQAGKRRAMQRHEFMVSFLQQFHGEWEGKC